MKRSRHFTFSIVFLILTLCLSLTNASVVYADEGTPTEPTVPSETEVPIEEPPPPIETDAAPTAEEPPPAVETIATPTAEEPAAETLLAELPENTDVVVLDENGEPVSLASQEAAEILVLPDPQFCPTGYDPGDDECGEVRTTIQAAVDDAKAAGVAGTVYIQSGTYNEAEIRIEDFAAALTLQGVLSLDPYTLISDPASRPIINGRILIQDGSDVSNVGNTADITLADLIVNNTETAGGDSPAIWANRNTADLILVNVDVNAASSGNSGLTVAEHSGDVILTNVDASGTHRRGATIDNSAGNGNVTVTESTFNDNSGDGLNVRSKGQITLVEVVANLNDGNGASISNRVAGVTAGVFVVNSTFNNNGAAGLVAESQADVTLINVTAQANSSDGASGRGTTVLICGGTFSGNNTGVGTAYDVRGTRTGAYRYYVGDTTNWYPADASWSDGATLCSVYTDADGDQLPDQWDTDADNDGIDDVVDNCPATANPDQQDTDGDGLGNACDAFPNDPNNDIDGDGFGGDVDNCPLLSNVDQADADGDGAGDVCDPFPFDADDDADGDGISGHVDNCPATANPDQKDTDSDSLGDACDNTLNGDTDGDGIDNLKDNCPTTANPGQEDSDGDGEGNACDTTPNGDTDKDGVDNAADNCPSVSGPSANGGCPWPSPATRTGGITATGAGVANQALVPVTGAQFTELSCNEPSTTLSMAGFQVAFTSLCGYSAALNGLEEAVLPGALPQGYAFTAGIDLTLSNNNNSVSTLPVGSSISLAYELPSGNSGDTLTILYWDPGANGGLGDWIEQDVTITDGKIVLTVETPGIFVIVQDTTSGQGPSQEYAAEDEFSSLLLAWFRKIALALSFN